MHKPAMTSRERLMRTLRREPTDRCPVRLWGVDPHLKPQRPTYQALVNLVNEFDLDSFVEMGRFAPGWFMGPGSEAAPVTTEETDSRHVGFREWHYTLHTPAGDLTSTYVWSPEGKPGYTMKHYIESLEDCLKWLSIPESAYDVDVSAYFEADKLIGERGIAVAGFNEPMYFVNANMGSEFFALATVDHREVLHEMIAQAYHRVEAYMKRALAAGVRGVWGYVGPELCIPPLASPRDFDEFVTAYDRPLIDLVHEAGGMVWCHCHGNMAQVLEKFADDLHIDCLQPIEPPPIGIPLAEAKARVGDRMSLEGNLEVGWMELHDREFIRRKTLQALQEGMPGAGFILSLSSDHSHWLELSEKIQANYRVFAQTAMENCWY